MIKNEIAELRRRFKPDYNAISTIYGYYINSNKDVISTFDTSLGLMEQAEIEIYLSVLKKTLSGSIGRNLIDIEFSGGQVEDSPEHRLLMKCKDSQLKDEEARIELVNKIIPTVGFDEDNYLILMAADAYDLAYRDANLEDMAEGGSEVYKYFLCCICPVKPSKLKLGYDSEAGEFHSIPTGHIAASPELGFMFPAFDDRSTNIYNGLFYTKKPSELYQEFIDEIFNLEKTPMSAPQQKSQFQEVIAETLNSDCSFQVIKNLNQEMRDKVENHKIDKIQETLQLSIGQVADVLIDSGADADKVQEFTKECEERFGKYTLLQPENIVEVKKFQVETPDVKITVNPEKSSQIKTKVIDGARYIIIPAADGIVINGMNVSLDDLDYYEDAPEARTEKDEFSQVDSREDELTNREGLSEEYKEDKETEEIPF